MIKIMSTDLAKQYMLSALKQILLTVYKLTSNSICHLSPLTRSLEVPPYILSSLFVNMKYTINYQHIKLIAPFNHCPFPANFFPQLFFFFVYFCPATTSMLLHKWNEKINTKRVISIGTKWNKKSSLALARRRFNLPPQRVEKIK